MRVCQLSHVEHTYNFLAPLFQALSERGHTVVAACNLESDGRVARGHLGDDVTLHRVPGARRLRPAAVTTDVFRLARYLRRERFDVLHVHGSLVSMQARLAAKLAGVPVVVHQAHGFPFHDGQPPWLRRCLLLLERFFSRHLTDVVVTVSEEDARVARAGHFRPEEWQLVHVPGVGIDVDRFRPPSPAERARLRSRYRVADDEVVLLFVGRLVAEKGIRELADAFAELAARHPDARLWVVGDLLASERDTVTAPAVLQQLRAGPLRSRVRLLGRRHDVRDLMQAADAFVLPSYREGMPVSLLEAMACALPVVTTDVRGCREAVAPGESGLVVPPREPDALAQALDLLVAQPPLRRAMGEEGRRRVVSTYSLERSTAPLVALYDGLSRNAALARR